MGFIYLITNTVNGKQYVGQTKKVVLERWKQHCYYASNPSKSRNVAIVDAIRKYGSETFTVRVLETVLDPLLNEAEKKWIKVLRTKGPNGYNLTDGGIGSKGCKWSESSLKNKKKEISQETRMKRSASLKGRVISEEHRQKLSHALKGHVLSKETRDKISATLRSRRNK